MEGFYEPATWKEMAPWAPDENTAEAVPFLEMLIDLGCDLLKIHIFRYGISVVISQN